MGGSVTIIVDCEPVTDTIAVCPVIGGRFTLMVAGVTVSGTIAVFSLTTIGGSVRRTMAVPNVIAAMSIVTDTGSTGFFMGGNVFSVCGNGVSVKCLGGLGNFGSLLGGIGGNVILGPTMTQVVLGVTAMGS